MSRWCSVRHAITKLAHIHFAANEQFAERVRRMGEQEFRIFVTGGSLVDAACSGLVTTEPELRMRYRLKEHEHLILTVLLPAHGRRSRGGR